MQIIDRHGKTVIKLRMDEARRLRDAAYILKRAGRNLSIDEVRLNAAAETALWFVAKGTTEQQRATLDRQDAEQPPIETKKP